MLDHLFNALWPELEEALSTLPAPEEIIETKRSTNEMVAEILDLSRAEANRRKKSDSFDAYIPLMNELMSQTINATKHGVPLSTLLPPMRVNKPARKYFFVKLQYDDDVKVIQGTSITEDANGGLVVLDGEQVVARFDGKVERWWTDIQEPTGS